MYTQWPAPVMPVWYQNIIFHFSCFDLYISSHMMSPCFQIAAPYLCYTQMQSLWRRTWSCWPVLECDWVCLSLCVAVCLCVCWQTGCQVHIVRAGGGKNLSLLPTWCGFKAPTSPPTLSLILSRQQLSGGVFFTQRPQ